MSKSDKVWIIKYVFIILFVVLVMALGIRYAIWQFNLCYPEVSNSIWYCLQHAS